MAINNDLSFFRELRACYLIAASQPKAIEIAHSITVEFSSSFQCSVIFHVGSCLLILSGASGTQTPAWRFRTTSLRSKSLVHIEEQLFANTPAAIREDSDTHYIMALEEERCS